mgnify:CR=1 FL=1
MNTDTNLITVTLPDGTKENIPEGTSLLELSEKHKADYKSAIVAAKVDNDIKELTYVLNESCNVEFIDLTCEDGIRIYRRSLYFILVKAMHDLFPDKTVMINHTIGDGIYCKTKDDHELSQKDIDALEKRMREIVEEKIPFIKQVVSVEEAKDILMKYGRLDRFHAIEHRRKPYVTLYTCGDLYDYFYGYMVPHTGYIDKFALKRYPPGLVLIHPTKKNPSILPEFKEQKKLFSVFSEYKNWLKIIGVENVGALNDVIKSGNIKEVIRVSEALHEKKIAQIADMIAFNPEKKKIVLISGPSSSGKTTFAQRLSIQLRVNGLRPLTISLDDYFVDRTHTPKDENGEYDFEALEAIDIELFNKHLEQLISFMEVEIPIFNFINGTREEFGRKLQMTEDSILVIEGIHGLNEKLTASIPRSSKFKIYVSALTSMNIDDHNRIPTTDTRIIRRIVRDFQFRGNSAVNTISMWPSVRRGEERNIFPFQEEADVMFNSFLIYELSALKVLAEPLLSNVSRNSPEYSEAKRLIEFLSYFLPIDACEIPANSIIREFIGGSTFF